MKKANITELRDHLSKYLDHVRSGGHVIIFERNEPVAEIVPLGSPRARGGAGDETRLAALEREGIIRRAAGRLSPDLLTGTLPGARAGVLEALLEERKEGR